MRSSYVVLVCVAASAMLQAQQPSPQPAGPVISSAATEVVLDVVARDKRGRPVRDLEQNEFHVTDNGEPVKISSFRLVDRRSTAGAAAPGQNTTTAAMAHVDPTRQLRLVTLAFERLGPESRPLARQAALDMIKGPPEPNVYYAVFTIDQRLAALQPFTNDRDLLKKAIEKATGGAFTQFAAESDQIKTQLEHIIGGVDQQNGLSTVDQVSNLQPVGNSQSSSGHDQSTYLMARLMLNMLELDQRTAVQEAGRSSLYSLLSLVKDQTALPGRKALMYFSEGLVFPSELIDIFNTVVGLANRSNVSIYSIDARGLQGNLANSDSNSMLASAMASSRDQATHRNAAVRPDEVRVSETAENSLRANTENNLAELSDRTGGFLIANTNDLRGPLRRVNEDLASYYEITYTPHIEKYDGSFRKIDVKLDRPNIKLQSRSGYFALPNTGGAGVLPFEMALISALNGTPLPKNVIFRSAALKFHGSAARSDYALLVEVPLSQVKLEETTAKITLHLGVEALVKNSQGAIVHKFSQDVPLRYDLDRKADVQAGSFLFKRRFSVPPGRYTVETAVADFQSNTIGARKSALVVPSVNGLSLSDIILVDRFSPAGSTDATDFFRYQNGEVTPRLSDYALPSGSQISVFFVVYPDTSSAAKPQLEIELLKDEKVLARVPMPLPDAAPDGRIPYVASIPTTSLPMGEYLVRVNVTQASVTRRQERPVQLQ